MSLFCTGYSCNDCPNPSRDRDGKFAGGGGGHTLPGGPRLETRDSGLDSDSGTDSGLDSCTFCLQVVILQVRLDSRGYPSAVHHSMITPIRLFSSRHARSWALELLCVTAAADKATLRQAYYKQALKCHPDSPNAEKKDPVRFNQLAQAYALLTGRSSDISCTESASTRDQNPGGVRYTKEEIWSLHFFGRIKDELEVDRHLINEVIEASALQQGGLDRGGMWELARSLGSHHTYAEISGDNAAEVPKISDGIPAPARRKFRSNKKESQPEKVS